MLERPQFKPHFQVEVLPPDTVFLLSEDDAFSLTGSVYVLLASLLDGTRDRQEILEAVAGRYSEVAAHFALSRLERRGYLCERVQGDPAEAAYWSMRDVPPAEEGRGIAVAALGSVPAAEFETALKALDVRVESDPETADLVMVVADDYLDPRLAEWNEAALRTGRPWMLVKPVGRVLWLGPILVPGVTACWRCLSERLADNRPVETFVALRTGRPGPSPVAALPSTVQTAVHAAATLAVDWLRTDADDLRGTLVSLDSAGLDSRRHRLIRDTTCRACGTGEVEPDRRPIVPASRKKTFTTDGGHRTVSPEETLSRHEHLISPITGVVRDLRAFETGSPLITVYAGAHSFGRPGHDLASLRRLLVTESAGKGRSDAQAKASALSEAIERHSGVFTGREPRLSATYAGLGESAVHPAACLQFSDEQYRGRERWNREHSGYAWVPEPFDESREIEWTPVWSLSLGRWRYLPTAFCYYGYPLPDGHRFCVGDSNGNASGNNLEEAILQGFMELVERDGVAVWWYNRLRRPALDLDSVADPYLAEVRAEYTRRGREMWVLDLTGDLGIPTYAAVSARVGRPDQHIIQGYGAHLDPKIALLRAVTEMNQMMALTMNEPLDFTDDPDNRYWYEHATLANQPYLLPHPGLEPAKLSDHARRWSDDLRDDIQTCVDIVAAHGMETLILDQTRPGIGMNVVKVIVPGLRHFWARFAPGRLYDVPVKLGWLPRRLREDQLNPLPISS
ncbi:TOMM precursor leader peptide-binding protein [Planobispora takensis]|uniref:YcaO domain-containing protein n=1 Tax=Planobispora takensis TaxID=1367882 RepID=A0A8J3T443_9ACTN|nr:TOMM precursor leader peptide-binding protein [Planobispora takensis]GII05338.1 hypothetical protein Pta02_73460 [Planobispora takensis]